DAENGRCACKICLKLPIRSDLPAFERLWRALCIQPERGERNLRTGSRHGTRILEREHHLRTGGDSRQPEAGRSIEGVELLPPGPEGFLAGRVQAIQQELRPRRALG